MLTGLVVKTLASRPVGMFSSSVVERSVGVLENKLWSQLQRVKLNTLHCVRDVRSVEIVSAPKGTPGSQRLWLSG